jgi:hypothetical protein
VHYLTLLLEDYERNSPVPGGGGRGPARLPIVDKRFTEETAYRIRILLREHTGRDEVEIEWVERFQ